MSLDTLVQVSIVAQSTGVARQGFGVPLIAHYHTRWPERVRAYTSVQAMIDDGSPVGDAAVRAASAIMSQIPSPPLFKIGRMATTPVAHAETLVPTPIAGAKYSLAIADADGVLTTFNYTADSSPTVAEICAALMTALNADTGLAVTASGGTANLVLTGDNAGEVFYLRAYDNATGHAWRRTCTNADPGIAADLAAIAAADNDWYGLVVTNPARACLSAAAAWAETNRKLHGITTGDTDCRDATTPNIMDDIHTANQAHSFALYTDRPQEFTAVGWMGRMFPQGAGASTWAYKTIRNASTVSLSETQKTNIKNVEGNCYVTEQGAAVTFPGKTGAGEWIDVTYGIDAVKARVQEDVFSVLKNNEKVPYTDQGALLFEGAIRGALANFARPDLPFLKPETIVVIVPPPAAISAGDRANRHWPGITFSADLQGAAHTLAIKGTLSV
jgi:hypothetical protein